MNEENQYLMENHNIDSFFFFEYLLIKKIVYEYSTFTVLLYNKTLKNCEILSKMTFSSFLYNN